MASLTRLRYRDYTAQAWTYSKHSYSKCGEVHLKADIEALRRTYEYVEVHRGELDDDD